MYIIVESTQFQDLG